MRPIGFSTGALAKADFLQAIFLQSFSEAFTAIELSALRDHELAPLVEATSTLALDSYSYVSVHAPSRLTSLTEERLVSLLLRLPEQWTVVAHPQVTLTPMLWESFGDRLCIENMDLRKDSGRTCSELHEIFSAFSFASMCFDVGHARQVDPTMNLAHELVRDFGDRIAQVHCSEVETSGKHTAMSETACADFRSISRDLPADTPVIIESMIRADQMQAELARATESLGT